MCQPASEPVLAPAAATAAALRALAALSDAVMADVGTAFFTVDGLKGGYGPCSGTVARASSRLGPACAPQAQPSPVTERVARFLRHFCLAGQLYAALRIFGLLGALFACSLQVFSPLLLI